jgi:Peptidase M50B-like
MNSELPSWLKEDEVGPTPTPTHQAFTGTEHVDPNGTPIHIMQRQRFLSWLGLVWFIDFDVLCSYLTCLLLAFAVVLLLFKMYDRSTVHSVTSVAIDEASPSDGNHTKNDADDEKQQQQQQRQYIGFKRALFREWKILLLSIVMLICMNIPYVKYIFYPFDIFATWIHEMCHGLAGIMVGGKIDQLFIYPDTSGLAFIALPAGYSSNARAFVASAGYQGTAVVGFLLLVLRRTKRGPRSGLFLLAFWMLLSVALWIRNAFGIVAMIILGLLFLLAAWKLSSAWMRAFYTVICVTVSLNAIANCYELFGSSAYVNGQPSPTDAHTIAELKGGAYWMWASLWLVIALVFSLFGIVLAIPGPNEDPAFRCCGMCLDAGLFWICNATRNTKTDEATSSETNGANGTAASTAA